MNQFALWFAPKAPNSYKNWFGRNLNEKLNDINNAYVASFGSSLFDIDIEDILNEISNIENNIKTRNDAKDKTFTEYDKRSSNGIPKAIINKYYMDFLHNYDNQNGEEEPIDGMEEDRMVNYFSYEKDLQNSLISQAEELFPGYKIFGNNGEGIEYNINGKKIDLLLENANEKKLLIVELKAGLADYKVCGQIQMYMGPLMQNHQDKEILGVIIAGEIDDSLKMAILANKQIKTMTYKMKLTLEEIM
jgi:predicted nuclease of restriction endonuclease-like (RecB) superfamily